MVVPECQHLEFLVLGLQVAYQRLRIGDGCHQHHTFQLEILLFRSLVERHNRQELHVGEKDFLMRFQFDFSDDVPLMHP